MKKLIIFSIVLLTPFFIDAQYTLEQRRQDSTLIYETYKNEIEFVKKDTSPSHIDCQTIETIHDKLTVCAKVRLGNFNKKTYTPIEIYNAEGIYGEAYRYPNPNEETEDFKKTSLRFYSIIYETTMFTTKENGGTKIPYVNQVFYSLADGNIINKKKLDPITLEELK